MLAKGAAGAAGSREGVRHRGSNENRVFVGFKVGILPDEFRRDLGELYNLAKNYLVAKSREIINFVNFDPQKFHLKINY